MSLGNQFQLTLPSNVIGNEKNKAGMYETTLATPLDLYGEWEVAIIDMSYPHMWVNLQEEYSMSVLTYFNEDESSYKVHVAGDEKTNNLISGMEDVESFNLRSNSGREELTKFYTRNTFTIVPGQYDINTLLHTIQYEINKVGFGLNWTRLEYNEERSRVRLSEPSRLSILATYKSHSLLRLLGFEKNIKTTTGPKLRIENGIIDSSDPDEVALLPLSKPEIEYMMLDVTSPVEGDLPPLIKPITSIFVYTDIIEYVLVGNTQTPLLGYFPVQSKWGEQAYWSFNPAYYVRVN